MPKENLVLAVDLDGTLIIDNNNGFHPRDVEILRDGLPFPLIIATGRSLKSTRYPFEKNGLDDGQPLPYPLVLNNGGLLFGPNEDPQAQFPFSPAVAAELIRIALAHPEATCLLQGITDIYQIGETEDGLRSLHKYGYFPPKYDPDNHLPPLTKVMVFSECRAILEGMAASFAYLPIAGNFSLDDIYELTPRGVNKGVGLKKLLAIIGMENARLVAAGDGDNDAAMFSVTERSFAPVTASESIRALADQVIDPRPRGLLTPILEQIL